MPKPVLFCSCGSCAGGLFVTTGALVVTAGVGALRTGFFYFAGLVVAAGSGITAAPSTSASHAMPSTAKASGSGFVVR
jgi:hypothetical protein